MPLNNSKKNLIDHTISNIYRRAIGQTDFYRRHVLTEIARVIDFDGALWGTGHLESNHFHSVEVLGVDESYPLALAETRNINPIYDVFKANPGKAVNMQHVVEDESFYSSKLYLDFFARFGVERVMGVILSDETTGIFTLISLYRFERDHVFSEEDGDRLERLAFHMVRGASQAYFLHLSRPRSLNHALAICDQHGVFYEAQPEFIRLLKTYVHESVDRRLPFSLDKTTEGLTNIVAEGKLCFRHEKLGDLFCISLWERSPIDMLSEREQEVVNAVVHGLSFKEAAKKLNVAPSTVSNHLYKIYRKLNVSSRTELAELANPIGLNE